MGKKYLLTEEQIGDIYDEGRSHWDGWFKDCNAFDWCGEMLEKCEYDKRTCTVEFYDNGWDALAEIEYADPHWELSCGHSTYGVTKPCYCSECGAKVVE